MSDDSQISVRGRLLSWRGLIVSYLCCIVVGSRKHHRFVRRRSDRDGDHFVEADPYRDRGARLESRRWRLGVGHRRGSRTTFFAT